MKAIRFTASSRVTTFSNSTFKFVGDRKVVKEIWCMGPGPNFSIELNGETVLNGTSAYEDFTTLFGAEVHARGAALPDGSILRVEFTSAGLFVVSLSAAESAVHEN